MNWVKQHLKRLQQLKFFKIIKVNGQRIQNPSRINVKKNTVSNCTKSTEQQERDFKMQFKTTYPLAESEYLYYCVFFLVNYYFFLQFSKHPFIHLKFWALNESLSSKFHSQSPELCLTQYKLKISCWGSQSIFYFFSFLFWTIMISLNFLNKGRHVKRAFVILYLIWLRCFIKEGFLIIQINIELERFFLAFNYSLKIVSLSIRH